MRKVRAALGVAGVVLTTALSCTLTTNLDKLRGDGSGGGVNAAGGMGGSATSTTSVGGTATGGNGAAGGNAGSGGGLSGYAGRVIADGAVAYYRLDETTTPTAFDSAGSNDGTYINSLMLDQPGLLTNNACVDFGMQGEVSVSDVFDFAPNDAFTVEAWIYGLPTTEGFIAGKLMWDGAYHGWMLVTDPSGPGVRFQRHGGKNLQAGDIVEDSWNHVVGTYDTVTMRLYLNGAEVAASNPDGASIDNHDVPLRIGEGDNWGGFAGRIDEVAIYDRHLSAAEVLTHYETGLSGR